MVACRLLLEGFPSQHPQNALNTVHRLLGCMPSIECVELDPSLQVEAKHGRHRSHHRRTFEVTYHTTSCTSQGRKEKMELVYNYLASTEFQQRVAGIVEAFVTMRSDLEAAKRSMKRIWSKREKQLQRAVTSTAGLYGDLQGIIGGSLPEIEGLSLPRIATSDTKSMELPPVDQ